MEDKLNKLKKGSIKTLIFYYSGEIKFEKSNIEFDVLHRKITEMMENGNKFKYYKQNDDFSEFKSGKSKVL